MSEVPVPPTASGRAVEPWRTFAFAPPLLGTFGRRPDETHFRYQLVPGSNSVPVGPDVELRRQRLTLIVFRLAALAELADVERISADEVVERRHTTPHAGHPPSIGRALPRRRFLTRS